MDALIKLLGLAVEDLHKLAVYDCTCSLCKNYKTCEKVEKDDDGKECWEWRYVGEWEKL